MRRRPQRWLILIMVLLVASTLTTGLVLAQSGGGYDLSWSTIDGGGGDSAGGDFQLAGTVGQPDAGVMSGGDFVLISGFWGGARPTYNVYVPLVLRNYP